MLSLLLVMAVIVKDCPPPLLFFFGFVYCTESGAKFAVQAEETVKPRLCVVRGSLCTAIQDITIKTNLYSVLACVQFFLSLFLALKLQHVCP